MGKGLVPADLDTWKKRRKAIAPAFHVMYLEAMVKTFKGCTGRTMVKFEDLFHGDNLSEGQFIEVDLEVEFSSLALDIIGLGVFNYDFRSVTKESPIIKHPSKMRKAQAEIDAVLQSSGLNFESLKNLEYIRHSVVEALRLYPQPPLLIRRSLRPDILP
ncbi:hypothetical protein AMTR_s00094p00104260, partial [Amborella trichopoda]